MYLVELFYPGSHIEHPDADVARKIESLIHLAEGELVTAAVALDDFESEIAEDARNPAQTDPATAIASAKAQWRAECEKSTAIRDDVERMLMQEYAVDRDGAPWNEAFQLVVERERRWRALALGDLPNIYERTRWRMFARAFLFSADTIVRILDDVAKTIASAELNEITRDAVSKFPDVRKVRNSSAHPEQRVVGVRGHPTRPIKAKSYEGTGIRTTGGGILHENLEGRYFGSTLQDGGHGGIELTSQSLHALHGFVQRALNALDWRGHAHWAP